MSGPWKRRCGGSSIERGGEERRRVDVTQDGAMADDTRALLAWLAVHDEACPVCGYQLRALVRDLCPECGQKLTLGVRAPEHRLAAWVVAMLSFALGLGFDGVVVVLMVWRIIVTGSWVLPSPVGALLVGLSVLGAACGAGILLLWFGRRWWFCRSRPVQIALTAVIFLGTGFVHGVVGLGIVI